MKAYGEITLTIINDGKDGTSPVFVSVGNESQNIPCLDGAVLNPLLINIPFSGYRGTEKCSCAATIGALPNGMTVSSNTPSTNSEDGMIILNVSKDTTLGGNEVTSGEIPIDFTVENITLKRIFTWSKTNDGDSGKIYKLTPSSLVIKKGTDDLFSPTTITFSSTVSINDIISDYNGYFIISESTDGSTYTNKYLSSSIEHEIVYTPSSTNVKVIKCSISDSSKLSTILDTQSVIVLTDVDNIEPKLKEIKDEVSEVSSRIDPIEKSIKNEVWRDTIINVIDENGNTVKKSIENLLVSLNIDLNGISTQVKDVKTTVENDIPTLKTELSETKQNQAGFEQSVKKTYETKESASSKYTKYEQDANSFKQTVEDEMNGYKSELSETSKELSSRIESVSGDVTKLQQDTDGFKTTVKKNYVTKGTLESVQIGGRNLIRNSNTLEFDSYTIL